MKKRHLMIQTSIDGTPQTPVTVEIPEERSGELLVGRNPEVCLIVIENRAISRQHLKITWNGTEITIQDLGSRYGTSLNGKSIAKEQVREDPDHAFQGRYTIGDVHMVKAGDLIKLANTSIRVCPAETE